MNPPELLVVTYIPRSSCCIRHSLHGVCVLPRSGTPRCLLDESALLLQSSPQCSAHRSLANNPQLYTTNFYKHGNTDKNLRPSISFSSEQAKSLPFSCMILRAASRRAAAIGAMFMVQGAPLRGFTLLASTSSQMT